MMKTMNMFLMSAMLVFITRGEEVPSASEQPPIETVSVGMDGSIHATEGSCGVLIEKEMQEKCAPQLDLMQKREGEANRRAQEAVNSNEEIQRSVNDLETKLANAEATARASAAEMEESNQKILALDTRLNEKEMELASVLANAENSTSLKEKIASLEQQLEQADSLETSIPALESKYAATEKLLKMELARKEELILANQKLENDIKSREGTLLQTKEQLFTVTRDLYESNEKIRDYERQHGWIIEYASATRQYILAFSEFCGEMVEPFRIAAKPLIDTISPYYEGFLNLADPVIQVLKAGWARVKADLLPMLGAFWRAFVAQVKDFWSRAVEFASPHISKAFQQLDEATAAHRQQAKNTTLDYWGQFLDATEEPRNQVALALKPLSDKIPWEKIPSPSDVQQVLVGGLWFVTDLLVDFFTVQNSPEVLLNASRFVNENCENAVLFIEVTFVSYFFYALLFG